MKQCNRFNKYRSLSFNGLFQLRKKVTQDEKIEELQRAVSQLQLAAAKREAVEQRLRNKLEEEIRNLKEQNNVS